MRIVISKMSQLQASSNRYDLLDCGKDFNFGKGDQDIICNFINELLPCLLPSRHDSWYIPIRNNHNALND